MPATITQIPKEPAVDDPDPVPPDAPPVEPDEGVQPLLPPQDPGRE